MTEEKDKKGNIDNANEDTKIIYFKDPKITDDLKFSTEHDIDRLYTLEAETFTFPKETKVVILNKIAEAMSQLLGSPYVIMVPRSMFRGKVQLLSYPITFLGETVFIVPWIREVLVYERD